VRFILLNKYSGKTRVKMLAKHPPPEAMQITK
jgi:hypothetical protein